MVLVGYRVGGGCGGGGGDGGCFLGWFGGGLPMSCRVSEGFSSSMVGNWIWGGVMRRRCWPQGHGRKLWLSNARGSLSFACGYGSSTYNGLFSLKNIVKFKILYIYI